jgi:hypothetical protein
METEGSLPCSQEPPLAPILSQIDPVHTITSYLCKIHFNIVHPPTSWLISCMKFHNLFLEGPDTAERPLDMV